MFKEINNYKKIKTGILSVICFVIIATCSFSVFGQNLKPNNLVWGSASLGSQGYIAIEAFCSTLNKNTNLKNSSISTAGGAENLALIDQEEIQFGQGMRLDLYNAYHGMPPYKNKIDFVQVFAYSGAALGIAVMPDSTIKSVEDLAGKRLCAGPANGGAVPLIKALLQEYGVLDSVNLVYMAWAEAGDALDAGQVDASGIWITGGLVPHAWARKLDMLKGLKLVDMDRDKIANIAKVNEGVTVGLALKDSFNYLTDDKVALGSSSILVADPNLDEEMVYNIVKTIFDNEEEIRNIDVSMFEFNIDTALGDNIISQYPFHPGAARYFKEIGIWTDDLIVYSY